MITIDGTLIKTPSDYSVGIMDIDDAKRNTKGIMLIENITKKRKLEMTWKYMSIAELTVLSGLVKNADMLKRIVTVVYPNQIGTTTSGSFYSGDLVAPFWGYRGDIAQYKNIKLSLVEV